MAEKRKRSPNWLSSEKNLLIDIVQQHLSIIENKRTDGAAIQQKTAEWKIMSEEYNSQTKHSHRTGENLKAQWESTKKAVKKVSSNKRMQFIQADGEPPKLENKDSFYKRVLGLIRRGAVSLHDPLDSDAPDTRAENHIDEVNNTLESQDMTHIKGEPFTPVSTPVPELSSSSFEFLHHKKAIESQKEHHDERRQAQCLHDINMQIKQEELKIKKEELKQSKIKTRLLLLELRLKRKNAGHNFPGD